MEEELDFLKEFPKGENDMFIVYDRFTFDNLFRLLLKADFDREDALMFMLANCSMSALVFQERLYNKKYRKISAEDTLPSHDAARRAKVIYDLIQIAQNHDQG
jgi:hypothetical protein